MTDKFTFKNKDEDFFIEEIHGGDVDTIIEFQKHLAIDSEGVILNEDFVRKATQFILDNPEYGIHFIIRTLPPLNANVSFALLCPELDVHSNNTIWWYNSVFTEKSYRRRGFFSIMHQFILKWAGSSKIKLYADEHNQGALQCYEKLGLKDTNEIFVEIDFFFSKEQIQFERNKDLFIFSIAKPDSCNEIFAKFNDLASISDKGTLEKDDGLVSILKSIKQGGIICIRENNKDTNEDDLLGIAIFGYEYSEWKLGHNVIITDVRFNQQLLQNEQKSQLVIQNIVSFLQHEAVELEASVKSVRFVVDRDNKKSIDLLLNAKLQPSHYIILSN